MKSKRSTWIGRAVGLVALLGSGALAAPPCVLPECAIRVDGDLSDWEGIPAYVARERSHLRTNPRAHLDPSRWEGEADLSFQWRGAWSGNRLFFAVEVRDDRVTTPREKVSFECDCVEIYLDYGNRGGPRVKILDGRSDWFARCDPRELMGYEMHFLAADVPDVYLDHTDKYALDKPQTERFRRDWRGQAVVRKTPTGYLLETSFEVPNLRLQAGKILGVEIAVCDNDGAGRDNVMTWTGTPTDFWLTMDDYSKTTLVPRPKLGRVRNSDGAWGLAVSGGDGALIEQPWPLQMEWWDPTLGAARDRRGGYTTVEEDAKGLRGVGPLAGPAGCGFEFVDRWVQAGCTVRLDRRVTVRGNAPGGFLSAATFRLAKPQAWPEVEWFVPGMIYGNFDHLAENSIGGRGYYHPGAYTVRIREDRTPAPLIAALTRDGLALAALNPTPNGETTASEAASVSLETMTDARFRFGAIGAEERGDRISVGYWYPGSEGEQSYSRKTAAGGETNHRWRRRYNPITDGYTQQYQVAFRLGRADGLNGCCAAAWRWAWQELKPQVNPQPLDAIRRQVVDLLAANVMEVDGRTGIKMVAPAVPGLKESDTPKSIMGFIGYAIGSAEMMLAESRLDHSERGRELRRKAEQIIASFTRIRMNPPEGEGFFIKTGVLTTSRGSMKDHPEIYLRCFCDDMKALMRAYRAEQQNGQEHPEWLAWVRQFADWLLTQQQPAGGFPRAWLPKTGQVYSDSPTGSFNAVPFYVQLNRLTGEPKYLEAARRAAEFCWSYSQARGRFIGGTIDNPDVIDKEAATISLEGYLALFDVTRDPRWLDRARAAADNAETWMYIWNVPLPAEADDAALHWKRGVPSVGLQLIASGHSLVDAYMCFDVDEYAQLYRLTADEHYLQVARILLHNTKAMIALPGRLYGLRGPGWQQEHYSIAIPRGTGRHQYWLPWVAVSQLQGMYATMAENPELWKKLAR